MENSTHKNDITVFVTYCWSPETHQRQVFDFVDQLRINGFSAEQDMDILQRENNLQKMMTIGFSYDKVIVVLSEEYKNKADNLIGGVGQEAPMIAAEKIKHPEKFVFVSLDNIIDTNKIDKICPRIFSGEQIIDINSSDKRNGYNLLHSKLLNEPIFERIPVSDNIQSVEKIHVPKSTHIIDRYNDNILNSRKYLENIFPRIQSIENENIELLTEQYSNLLINFITNFDDNEIIHNKNIFLYSYEIIIAPEINNPYPIQILGKPGTGKRTFLSILYKFVFHKLKDNNYMFIPFYLDLHYFITLEANEARAKIDDILSLFNSIKNEYTNSKIVFIIDSIEDHTNYEKDILTILNNFLKNIPNHKRLICIGSLSSDQKRKLPELFNKQAYMSINFNAIQLNDFDKIERTIEAYTQIYKINKEKIINKISKYSINELDLNILTLIKDTSDIELNTISELYYTYCLKKLGSEESLLNTAKLAFEYTYINNNKNINRKLIIIKEWDVIQQSYSMKYYLIAYYYVQCLLNYDKKNTICLNTIYPDDITFFIKQIIYTGGYDSENKYFEIISKLPQKLSYDEQANLCYLLGRFKFIQNEKIISLLHEYKKHYEKELEILNKNKKKITNKNDNKIMDSIHLLLRTISISLIYLKDNDEKNRYIEKLLNNPIANTYNSGFHLKFYGDLEYLPLKYSSDDSKINNAFEQTFKKLKIKINNHLDGNEDPLFEINLLTICSIIQARLQEYEKIQKEISETIKLIDLVLDSPGYITNKNFILYLYMMKKDLENGYKPFKLLDWVDKLFRIERSGWVKDKIDNPENVAEHIYSCWLIGFLYLPDSIPAKKGYSKNKVLETLLIHDIAEAEIGDILSNNKTETDKENEYRELFVFLMHDTYSAHEKNRIDYTNQKKLWENFCNKSDINAQIAYDIDKIQAYYRYRYYKDIKKHKFEEKRQIEWENEIRLISTDIGKQIFNKLFKNKINTVL